KQPLRRGERAVEQHVIDDEPHEQRLDHLQSAADQREQKEERDRIAVRFEPAQILAHVLAACALAYRALVRCCGCGIDAGGQALEPFRRVGRVVETPALVVLDEPVVPRPRRTRFPLAAVRPGAHRPLPAGSSAIDWMTSPSMIPSTTSMPLTTSANTV